MRLGGKQLGGYIQAEKRDDNNTKIAYKVIFSISPINWAGVVHKHLPRCHKHFENAEWPIRLCVSNPDTTTLLD